MNRETKTMRPEISHLVEALDAVLRTEEECYAAFKMVYGEDEKSESPVWASAYDETDLPSLFEALRNGIKSQIGEFVEFELRDLLSEIKPEKEEGTVC